ncbi:MAG: tRNA dihydrouridine synthase DusB [Hyphomicrobiales bacterium]|nr:tRNA dihydrouridine synthase DusB [Hyphomicrobiales bacterium]
MINSGEKISRNAPGALRLGAIELPGRAFLAPMSGITDIGMRRVASRCGAGLVISEMVAANFYIAADEETRLRAEGEGLPVHVVQIAGREPLALAEAARLAEAAGAHAIDINMGCPAKRVVGGYAGSALMREPDLALSLVRAVVAAVTAPVSVKMRLGWDADSLNAPVLARAMEAEGVALITVHGRTRNQFYKGRADWAAIRAVREAISIPLVANGDCASLADARAMLAASGADAAMIGRAAMGRPWLVGEIAAGLDGRPWRAPSPRERANAALEHYRTLLDLFGERQGVRHARKHLAAYADHAMDEGMGLSPAMRTKLVTTTDAQEAADLLEQAFQSAQELAA